MSTAQEVVKNEDKPIRFFSSYFLLFQPSLILFTFEKLFIIKYHEFEIISFEPQRQMSTLEHL